MKIIDKYGVVSECPAEEELHVLRHSAAHIMAQAIKRLFPQAYFAYVEETILLTTPYCAAYCPFSLSMPRPK